MENRRLESKKRTLVDDSFHIKLIHQIMSRPEGTTHHHDSSCLRHCYYHHIIRLSFFFHLRHNDFIISTLNIPSYVMIR